MASKIKVHTQGQTLRVTITTPAGTAPTVYTTSALSATHTMPKKIGEDTEFWLNYNWMPFDIQVAQPDGTVLYSARHTVSPDAPILLSPEPSAAQVATDAAAHQRLALAPAGALAETVSRAGTDLANVSTLTSGRLFLVAIDLPKGLTVSSATFVSATTAAGTPTNQWFALYDSSRVLIDQTADDTSTAWGANTAKTLSFASPPTTTYAGLHYLGIMVAASTAPTLLAFGPTSVSTGLAPILAGNSTTTLTDTAPDPAGAITAASAYPYAYVS